MAVYRDRVRCDLAINFVFRTKFFMMVLSESKVVCPNLSWNYVCQNFLWWRHMYDMLKILPKWLGYFVYNVFGGYDEKGSCWTGFLIFWLNMHYVNGQLKDAKCLVDCKGNWHRTSLLLLEKCGVPFIHQSYYLISHKCDEDFHVHLLHPMQSCQVTLDISGSPIENQWGSQKYAG